MISNPGVKAVSSVASSGLTVRFLGVIGILFERNQNLSNGTNVACSLDNYFVFTSIVFVSS
jgi:hypothetical protein